MFYWVRHNHGPLESIWFCRLWLYAVQQKYYCTLYSVLHTISDGGHCQGPVRVVQRQGRVARWSRYWTMLVNLCSGTSYSSSWTLCGRDHLYVTPVTVYGVLVRPEQPPIIRLIGAGPLPATPLWVQPHWFWNCLWANERTWQLYGTNMGESKWSVSQQKKKYQN